MKKLALAALAAVAVTAVAYAQTGHQGHGAMKDQMKEQMQQKMQEKMQEKMQGKKMEGMDHSKMGHGSAKPADANEPASTKAFREANDRMHKDMDITFSGNADVDFVKGMIPHHAGAVDMAKILLAHGKDPELKKLGEEIVAAQEKEIAFMKAWLAKNGK